MKKRKVICAIGDKVEAHGGRIGTVIDVKPAVGASGIDIPHTQRVVVRLLDESTIEGVPEDFQEL
jgi:hypothetical protein